jgi:hypothetical protein
LRGNWKGTELVRLSIKAAIVRDYELEVPEDFKRDDPKALQDLAYRIVANEIGALIEEYAEYDENGTMTIRYGHTGWEVQAVELLSCNTSDTVRVKMGNSPHPHTR